MKNRQRSRRRSRRRRSRRHIVNNQCAAAVGKSRIELKVTNECILRLLCIGANPELNGVRSRSSVPTHRCSVAYLKRGGE